MKDDIKNIIDRLENHIQLKEHYLKENIQDIPQIISLLEDGFIELKEIVSTYKFQNEVDEIFFFKIAKPKLFSKLIYYRKVYNIEMMIPNGYYSSLRNYYLNELNQLENFYNKNIDFYKYYRSGDTYLDRDFFLRRKQALQITDESFSFERNPDFSTNCDFKVANVLANDMLSIYLNCKLAKLNHQIENNNFEPIFELKDKWTDKKSALVELIYAIHTVESVNSGNIELKALAISFGRIFNIDLSDLYHIFSEIRSRKIDRTAYINRLINALIKRMDEADSK